MYRSILSTVLLAIILTQSSDQALAKICKPDLKIKDIRISELKNLERTWTAAVHVDASSCVDFVGSFAIQFLREKENAPEIEFSETYTWQAGELGIGQAEASVDLWVDEVVHDYRLYASPCSCRD